MSGARGRPSVTANARRTGLVVASHGRHCLVETESGERLICHPRGKKSQVVVGDRVQWQPPATGQGDEGVVEAISTRRNLFYRQDELRTKSFAANLDQVLILVAADPEFSENQLSRALIAAEAEHIQPLIVLNKQDLQAPFARAWERLAPYRAMGYSVLPLALKNAQDVAASETMLQALRERLNGRATLVLGPSGAGKSSLINRLVPGAAAECRQAHDHQHHLVLAGRGRRPHPARRADRFTGLSGIRAEPYRADEAGPLHARLQGAGGRLPVLQLHAPPGTGLRRDFSCQKRLNPWCNKRFTL